MKLNQIKPAKYAQAVKHIVQNMAHERFPFYASFKVTLRCMYSCEFCNCWRGPKNDLPTEDIIKILQNLGRSSIMMTSFEGVIRDILSFLRDQNLFAYGFGIMNIHICVCCDSCCNIP